MHDGHIKTEEELSPFELEISRKENELHEIRRDQVFFIIMIKIRNLLFFVIYDKNTLLF